MDVVDVFLWFANESFLAAEKADGQRRRENFLQLGSLWADAANQAAVPNANVAGVGAPERAVVVWRPVSDHRRPHRSRAVVGGGAARCPVPVAPHAWARFPGLRFRPHGRKPGWGPPPSPGRPWLWRLKTPAADKSFAPSD